LDSLRERAAIIEFDGNISRDEAERIAITSSLANELENELLFKCSELLSMAESQGRNRPRILVWLFRRKCVDAFLHEHLIDKSTYQEQVDLLNEEIALVDLEIYETKLEELDLKLHLILRRTH
jgi:hypothetical protein